MESNSIINAIKRLERAGNENSRANQKLHEAVVVVADFLIETVPVGVHFDQTYGDGGEPLGYSEVEYNREYSGDTYSGPQLRIGLGVLRPKQGFVSLNYVSERDSEFFFAQSVAHGLIENAIQAVREHTSKTVGNYIAGSRRS